MKHIPILYSTPMVQALLEKRKTQTRRLKGLDKINASPNEWEFVRFFDGYAKFTEKHNALNEVYVKCPYGQPGDVLWVRENYLKRPNNITHKMLKDGADTWPAFEYQADMGVLLLEQYKEWGWTMKPSIHMPKAACRMWDMVKDVRVERLQEISEEDAIAEGVERRDSLYRGWNYKDYLLNSFGDIGADGSFETLWQSLNGADSWNANPWVWVIEFEPCAMPEDFLTR